MTRLHQLFFSMAGREIELRYNLPGPPGVGNCPHRETQWVMGHPPRYEPSSSRPPAKSHCAFSARFPIDEARSRKRKPVKRETDSHEVCGQRVLYGWEKDWTRCVKLCEDGGVVLVPVEGRCCAHIWGGYRFSRRDEHNDSVPGIPSIFKWHFKSL